MLLTIYVLKLYFRLYRRGDLEIAKHKQKGFMHKEDIDIGKEYNTCVEECQDELRKSRYEVEFQLKEW